MKKLLAILLLIALLVGCSSNAPVSDDTKPAATPDTIGGEENTEPTEEVTFPDLDESLRGYGNNDHSVYSSYSIYSTTPDSADMQAIIAINSDSEEIFNNKILQIAFWTEFMNFMNTYGQYAAYMGLDTTKPLSEQLTEEGGVTWEQFFLRSAVENLAQNYALAQTAYANGYVLSEEDQAQIDGILSADSDFAQEYLEQGYADADTYLQYYFGDGVDAKTYQDYQKLFFAAADCYYAELDILEAALTEAAVEAHFDANAEEFAEQGYRKCNNIHVRHILIQPEGEQADWTDADWTTAEVEAQALYDRWQATPTEEAFAELAKEKTMDPGSAETGGLYEDVTPGSMVAPFDEWCFDETRQPGDHGIVKTTYGYHIMYFVGEAETNEWYDMAADDLLYSQIQEYIAECKANFPLKFDYSLIRIFDVSTANAAEPAG